VDLSGKSVFIPGTSRGISCAIAIAYAKARASFIGLRAHSSLSNVEEAVLAAAQQAVKPTPTLPAVQLDVTDPDSVDAAARSVDESLGRLDILINNADGLEIKLQYTRAIQ
jgi:NAD(P)-dependent dehydrogenase (short-subunit alcohol dehydrogenase family)